METVTPSRFSTYQEFLKNDLAARVKRNSRFSLRAYAQLIGLSHSTLSQVLTGKRKLSQERAHEIADRLKLESDERSYFSLLVELQGVKHPSRKAAILDHLRSASSDVGSVQNLEMEAFQVISEWYSFAILQLCRIPGLTLNVKVLSRMLKVSKIEIETMLDRLLRLELIEKTTNGFQRTGGRLLVQSAIHQPALKRFHRQYLEKAIEALEVQSPVTRFTASETMAIPEKLIPVIHQRARNFLNEISELVKHSKKQTEIHHLQINFFEIANTASKNIEGKKT